MKNASQIITSLQNKPQFSKLSRYKCIGKIQSAFTPALQKMIKFGYIKNDILFFVLTHPAGKQEFDNSIQTIKSALKFHMPKECEGCLLQDIRAFVTHTPPSAQKIFVTDSSAAYTERSLGNFAIEIQDQKLHALVQTIQKIIQSSHAKRENG